MFDTSQPAPESRLVRRAPQPPVLIGSYDDPNRYQGLTDGVIASALRHVATRLLMRGKLETLLARREIGGLLTEFARHHPRDRTRFEVFARRTVDMAYDEARRHMQLWMNWQRCLDTLDRLHSEAARANAPFIVPGLRKLLTLAGVVGVRRRLEGGSAIPPLELPRPSPLPDDIGELRRMVRRLQGVERDLRGRIVVLSGDLTHSRSLVRLARQEVADLRKRIRQMPNRSLLAEHQCPLIVQPTPLVS